MLITLNRILNPVLLFPLRKRLKSFQAGKILKRLKKLLKNVMPCLYIIEGATTPTSTCARCCTRGR